MIIANKPSLSGHRVLVIEDDYLIASALAESLEIEGVEVIGPVARVEEAIQLAQTLPQIDAALLDLNLRGAIAFPVADILLARQIPFILTTVYGRSFIPARYAHVPRLAKPVEVGRLADALFS